MSDSPIDTFMAVYADKLTQCVQSMPDEYFYSVELVPTVAERMRVAFLADTYNISSPAIRKTCKALGLGFTRKAIRAFLRDAAA